MLTFIIILAISYLYASESRVILKGDYLGPKFLPDGHHFIVSGPKYNGIYLFDLNGNLIDTISNEQGVGYSVAFSEDGNLLAYRVKKDDNFYIVVMDIQGRQVERLGPYAEPTSIVFINNEIFQAPEIPKTRIYPSPDNKFWALLDEDDNFRLIERTTNRKILSKDGRFYGIKWNKSSKRLVMNELGKGIHVVTTDGESFFIGEGTSPVWMPDGVNIVYEITCDDGKDLISSDIYLSDYTGIKKINLTNTPFKIELHPFSSFDGTKILFEAYSNKTIEMFELGRPK